MKGVQGSSGGLLCTLYPSTISEEIPHHIEDLARREIVHPTPKSIGCASQPHTRRGFVCLSGFPSWGVPVIVSSLPVAVLARGSEWMAIGGVALRTGRAPVIFRLVCGTFERRIKPNRRNALAVPVVRSLANPPIGDADHPFVGCARNPMDELRGSLRRCWRNVTILLHRLGKMTVRSPGGPGRK